MENPADYYRIVKRMGNVDYYSVEREEDEELFTVSYRSLKGASKYQIEVELDALITLSRNEDSKILRLQSIFEHNEHLFIV